MIIGMNLTRLFCRRSKSRNHLSAQLVLKALTLPLLSVKVAIPPLLCDSIKSISTPF